MFGADDRGQAIQIGAIILFSFVVIGFSLYQATVVPDQNAQVEFNHNQEVQQDLLELRSGVLSAGASGTGTTTTVQLGTQYPARVFAVNPGAPSGSLRTVDPGGGSTMTIANAEAQNDETADFWSGTGSPREYTTRGLRYQPNYNEFREAPNTVYENTVVYNRAPGGVSVQTGQQLVSGRELDLTVLLGSYQASQSESTSVDVSAPGNEPRTVVVQSRGDPINVTVPTGLSQSTWEDLLEEQITNGYVDSVSVSEADNELTITLQQTEGGSPVTYELRVPAAGIGTGVPDPAAAYVTDISGDGTSIPEGGTQQVVAEVRNEFNGPESGVSTCAALSPSSDGTLVSKTDTTTENGRTSFTYEAPDDVDRLQTAEITVGYVCDGSANPEQSAGSETKATFEIDVLNSDGSGGGNGGSTGSASQVSVTGSGAVDDDGSGTNGALSFSLENTGSTQVTLTAISVDSTTTNADFIDDGNPVFERTDTGTTLNDSKIEIGGGQVDTADTSIAGSSTASFKLGKFFQKGGGQGGRTEVDLSDEGVEITVYFADGSSKPLTLTG